MSAYYNEIDPFVAQWLRELIKAGHIAPGDVDERSIEDVTPNDIKNYTQCHFFAGIGVWSYALRRAGWPDDKKVYTGSCPCQPFSQAGKGKGFDDERHLWPSWHWLIDQCKPPIIFGEQVASKAAEPWIDIVQTDLEALGYAFGCVPFPAASLGAPHIRDRAYWVANASGERLQERKGVKGIQQEKVVTQKRKTSVSSSYSCRMAIPDSNGCKARIKTTEASRHRDTFKPDGRYIVPVQTNGFWRDVDWIGCQDGKFRPVKPGTFPLVDGATARVGRLRGYGNAIVAEQAKIFIEAVKEIT